MSEEQNTNPLASYFKTDNKATSHFPSSIATSSDTPTSSKSTTTTTTHHNDVIGSSFFDLISECKTPEIDNIENVTNEYDEYYDKWPLEINAKPLENSINTSYIFAVTEPLIDPIKQIVAKYYGTQELAKRVIPTADSVSADVNGLQILIVINFKFNNTNKTEQFQTISTIFPEMWLL
jgi:hypothetical protein